MSDARALSVAAVLGVLSVCALGAPACRAPTAITLEITTDVPCEKIRGTQIAVGSPEGVETKDGAAVTSSCKNGYVGTLVVIPSGDKSVEVGVRVVMGVDRPPEQCAAAGYAGCIVARRALHFIPHSDLTFRSRCASSAWATRATRARPASRARASRAASRRAPIGASFRRSRRWTPASMPTLPWTRMRAQTQTRTSTPARSRTRESRRAASTPACSAPMGTSAARGRTQTAPSATG